MGIYTVGAIRAAGLEARWSRTRAGAPILTARHAGETTWWIMSGRTYERAKIVGWAKAFNEATCLSRYFSVPV